MAGLTSRGTYTAVAGVLDYRDINELGHVRGPETSPAHLAPKAASWRTPPARTAGNPRAKHRKGWGLWLAEPGPTGSQAVSLAWNVIPAAAAANGGRRGHSSDSPAASCYCSSLYRPAQMSCFLEPEVGTCQRQKDEASLCCDPRVITAAGAEPALTPRLTLIGKRPN